MGACLGENTTKYNHPLVTNIEPNDKSNPETVGIFKSNKYGNNHNQLTDDTSSASSSNIFQPITTKIEHQDTRSSSNMFHRVAIKIEDNANNITIKSIPPFISVQHNDTKKQINPIIDSITVGTPKYDKFQSVKHMDIRSKYLINGFIYICTQNRDKLIPSTVEYICLLFYYDPIWDGTITEVKQCNKYQMIYMANKWIIENGNSSSKMYQRLIKYKDKIIQYFDKNDINGTEFMKMGRKQFSVAISEYCNNKKCRAPSIKLWKHLFKGNRSDFSISLQDTTSFMRDIKSKEYKSDIKTLKNPESIYDKVPLAHKIDKSKYLIYGFLNICAKTRNKIIPQIVEYICLLFYNDPIWDGRITELKQCNKFQMIYMTQSCIIDLYMSKSTFYQRLIKYNNKIIKYFDTNDINGYKFSTISRMDFSRNIARYCNNQKMKGFAYQLYRRLLKVDISNIPISYQDTTSFMIRSYDSTKSDIETVIRLHSTMNPNLISDINVPV